MKLFRKAGPLREHLLQVRMTGIKIGFVPTMGALHNGHMQLISASRQAAAITVCSIFVNPTQFNNPTDFEKYPKTLGDDIAMLEAAGNDIVFIPDVSEIYPEGTDHLQKFELGYLETILEGSSRPGHFQGVCQVMERLLTIIDPQLLFMGQKDYQQCMVVKKLIGFMGNGPELITAPTVRQPDGLAMSSRNRRLSETGRQQAVAIYQTLSYVKASLTPGPLRKLVADATNKLSDAGFTVDYVAIAHASSLEVTKTWDGNTPLVCLIAAFLEEVRLIDNMVIS
ncbi:MAG: pantoate--beta-alanine ligase [Chitinophagaceae bacterium]|nr:MAG: pantoate--beta-alanine ligase [Chitinophagaceae bacterium]